MNLSNLQPAQGSIHREGKRVGRGQGSGKGGTATRGHKGAKSRSGFSNKIGFEGGQMPLQRRIPKFGFKNFNRKEYVGINLGRLQELADCPVQTHRQSAKRHRILPKSKRQPTFPDPECPKMARTPRRTIPLFTHTRRKPPLYYRLRLAA